MKKTVNIVVFALLLLIFGSFMVTFQVRQDEVAFVETNGQTGDPINKPGLKFKLPWPFGKVYRFDKRIHVVTTPYGQGATKDGGSLVTQVYFGWKIKDGQARKFMDSLEGDSSEKLMEHAQEKLMGIVGGAKEEVIGAKAESIGKFIFKSGNESEAVSGLDFELLENEMLAKAKPTALENYGVEIQFIGIRRVGVAKENLDVVLDSMVKQWSTEAGTIEAEAQAKADAIRQTAQEEKERKIQEARNNADKQIAEAQDKATKDFIVLQTDPELAAFLMQLEALEKSVQKNTTLLLDDSMGPFPILRGLKPYLKEEE